MISEKEEKIIYFVQFPIVIRYYIYKDPNVLIVEYHNMNLLLYSGMHVYAMLGCYVAKSSFVIVWYFPLK